MTSGNESPKATTMGSDMYDYVTSTLFGKDPNQEQHKSPDGRNGDANGTHKQNGTNGQLDEGISNNNAAGQQENRKPRDPSNDNRQQKNDRGAVGENTIERSNPLSYDLRFGDDADKHQHRYGDEENDDGKQGRFERPSADQQRMDIVHGTYEDAEDATHFANQNLANGAASVDSATADYTATSPQQMNDRPNSQQRPSMPWRGSHKSESMDDGEFSSNVWRRRFSKFAPTSSFIGNQNDQTPGSSNNLETRKWNNLNFLGLKKKEKQGHAPIRDISRSEIEKELDEKTKQRAEFLLSSLIAGCPAALFAGSIFLRDEHGCQRAPLLLSLIGFQLTDITENYRNKHKTYRIDLEYGVGINRLKWSMVKDVRDFMALHARLKVLFFQSNAFSKKDVELPKFPRWGAQQKITNHKLAHTNLDHLVIDGGTTTTANGEEYVTPADFHAINDTNSQAHDQASTTSAQSASSELSHNVRHSLSNALSRIHSVSSKNDKSVSHVTMLNEAYKSSVEHYIDQLFITLTMRPQSNRLFQFFELSPIGLLLSSESGYQGKQGYLLVRTSAKAQGWRVGHLKLHELKEMVDRHTSKWFLVRNSYIMYVDDIYSTTPLEVFMVDSCFKMSFTGSEDGESQPVESDDDISLLDESKRKAKKKTPYWVIKLENSERKIKMIAKSEKHMKLWVNSINTMLSKTIWSQPKRFKSFAPIRDKCFAQWFVDARDYMWACSSALEMAKETIYIHDWWLSPELYMRRPADGNQQWRLDRILKRKAEQGVKIFVIVYRNVGNTVVTDSSWTKHSLLDLHPNVYVIRSPNQLLQNTYFWAHHEKLCIVDSTVCFLGGIDLCFGRFDTADHVLTDDVGTAFTTEDSSKKQKATEESIKTQCFPGKDYSNPRIKDFFSLDKPYESMYDRQEVPRMPWHDVHMVSAGQVARDLSRHFVQRWNYLLRQKRPSRPTPLLLPPSDLTEEEINKLGFGGTCEVQLLRSSGNWSIGLRQHEQSIQDAYLKVIETSEHFVYLENQFFVTSTEWDGTVIHNRIGDALVDRIIRAHHDNTPWRAVIVIPLMPGFESQVSEADGSAVRVIMQCQFISISRGSTSIFAKLRKVGIDPDDYIQFFSLRKWGRIGAHKKLVTEQLYIHGKTLMADDRIAIIGSANINERSMRGDRDSEVAAVVRDKEMIKTTMNGQPYLAGKFAHTLRMRLMREHLGVDVDILELVERRFSVLESIAKTDLGRLASTGKFTSKANHILSAMVEIGTREILALSSGTERWFKFVEAVGGDTSVEISLSEEDFPETIAEAERYMAHPLFHTFNHRAGVENLGMRDKKKFSSDSRIHNNKEHKDDIDGLGKDNFKSETYQNSNQKIRNIVKEWAKSAVKPSELLLPNKDEVLAYLNEDGIDYGKSVVKDLSSSEEDHLVALNRERWTFLKRISYLQRCATKAKSQQIEKKNNANGDSPLNKSESKETFSGSQNVTSLNDEEIKEAIQSVTAMGTNEYNSYIDPYEFEDPLSDDFYESVWYTNAVRNTRIFRMVFHSQPDDAVETWNDYTHFYNMETEFEKTQKQGFTDRPETVDAQMANAGPVKPIDESDNRVGVLAHTPHENEESSSSSGSMAGNETLSSNTTPSAGEDVEKGAIRAKGSIQSLQQEASDAPEAKKVRRRRRAGTFTTRNRNAALADNIYDKQTAEKLLEHIHGHLVLFPTEWLHKELEKGGSWFFNADRLPPVEIYD